MNRKQRRIEQAQQGKKSNIPAMTTPHLQLLSQGVALQQAGRLDEAAQIYQALQEVYPQDATLNYAIGLIHVKRNEPEQGLALLSRAISLKPDFAEAHIERAMLYRDAGRYPEATAGFDKAIAVNPNYADAHFGKAMVKLVRGEFNEGWKLYEWRWKGRLKHEAKHYPAPLWLGKESLEGKTILLHTEQGLGDAIQLCRYVPLIAAMGAQVILAVPQSLRGLVATLKAQFIVVTDKETIPPFDYHCPLFSLPLAMGTHAETIPSDKPYLFADSDKRNLWSERLSKRSKPRVGLVWSGNANHTNDYNRSIPLLQLNEVLAMECEFHSLQKDVRPGDQPWLEKEAVRDHSQHLHDFTDTAALAAEMDLVISVDTSTAHLAGALGLPVCILLPFSPDFRWLLDRQDSPWYPTATLLRQARPGDWFSVIEQLKTKLSALIAQAG